MDVDRSTASASARSSGNFHRSPEHNCYSVPENGRNSRQSNVGRSFRSLFKRDRHFASKGWFNPEDFIIQKRQWAKQEDKDKVIGWPAHLFEQFLVVGLPPTTDVKSVISDAETLQTAKSIGDDGWDIAVEPSEGSQHRGLKGTPLDPQVLYSYPPEAQASPDLPSFCFPHGVQPTLLERTPSMSSLNDLLYSQNYLNSDASSFIFLLKVADNLPLYGVCCYMDEMLHRPPSLLKAKYPDCDMPLSRYMVAAPRCYCFLTHYPFFSLHMKVLHMILGLERLDRITMFIDEVASMPLGGGRGLSGRLDSRELPLASAGAPAGTSSSWQAAGHQQGTEEEQRQRQQGRGVKQLHTTSAGPSPLGSGRSSMPDFQAGPPPVTTGQGGTDSAFPLNPHKSYDEEWGTMPSGGGHDSDSDVYLTPHAESAHFDMHQDDTSSGFRQQAPHALSDPSVVQPSQSPSKSSASAQLSVNGAASQPWLQPHRRPPEPPHPRLDLPSSASAPVGPPTGPPSTPERPHPSTSDKFYSPQHQQQQQSQAYTRSPSSLLSRASARIRVALEASEATIKAGPADPPPRQPGLPPSSGHRRTSSHQVNHIAATSGGTHRRSRSWQQQQQQQQAAMQQSGLDPERSRGSESTLGGYMTANSEAPSSLSEAGHAEPSPLANVQQHLRNFSAQSLSGFSDPGTPQSGMGDRPDYPVNPSSAHRGPPAFSQGGSHAASQSGSGITDLQWGRLGERPVQRVNSDPMAPVSPFAVANQQPNTVPAQWQTFDQASATATHQAMQLPGWEQQQSGQGQPQPRGQQPQAHIQHQQPRGQDQPPTGSGWDDQQGDQPPWQQQGLGQEQGLWQGQGQQQDSWQDQRLPMQGQGPGPAQQHWQGQGHDQPPWRGQGQAQPLWPNSQGQALQQAPWQGQSQAQPQQGPGQASIQLQEQLPGDVPLFRMQGQGPPLQPPPGRLQGAPSGVPFEHRTKTMRTMSFRQVVRSASEGDAMCLQAEPANALQVMQAYERSSVPQPGEEFEFCPDASLQPVHYQRGRASEGLVGQYVHRAAIAAAEAEAGEGLGSWTVAALCRSLSLDNILLLLTGALLEKQVVMFCPNIGLLSTCVLSLIPLLRPFSWHSFLMPVLPDKLLGFLEAPVPFIIGVQYKTSKVRSKCTGLMRVNLYKDQISTVGSMPPLPNDKALYASLRPAYNVLKAAGQERAHGRPMYAITDDQKKAAGTFLKALQDYLSSICSELQSYTIADVQTPDRVAVLLEDSYIESFPSRDRAFVKQFTKTTMFSVYCDSVIR